MNTDYSSKLQLPENIVKLLTEVGFLACGYVLEEAANIIFDFLHCYSPSKISPFIGKVVMCLNKGDYVHAEQILQECLSVRNRSKEELGYINCFLGMTAYYAGNKDAMCKYLQEVLDNDEADHPVVNLAKLYINL